MKLQNLIHTLRNENSSLGECTREIERDSDYHTYKNEQKLKSYLSEKMKKKGMLGSFAELLSIHELINYPLTES
ncbi:MAG: hypothetical protein ACJA2N_001479 [Salibacteraceae bacterium]|jgi:hypothetical protein